jgi:hypothetical protein
MKIFARFFLLVSFLYAIMVVGFIAIDQQHIAKANTSNSNVVISQIQVSGNTSTHDEFVELYNPTNIAIDITKWKLGQKSKTSTQSATLVASMSGSVAPKSYRLITSNTAVSSNSADILYSNKSTFVSPDNTVLLYDKSGNIVDEVGLGAANDNETFATINPDDDQSVARKATETSNTNSLSTGGSEEHSGNGYDTDNNANDFVLLSTSMPRNSQSQSASTPTPTVLPTTTPAPTTIPTATVVPTVTPTITSVPTQTPTLTATPEPTDTIEPSPTDEITPTPTTVIDVTGAPTPSIAITPTVTPSPTPVSGVILDEIVSPRFRLVCTQTVKTIKIFGHTFTIPQVHCELIKIKEQPKHHSNHDNDNNHR